MKHSNKSSTILMFVVFFLTSVVLWNVSDLISKVERQKQGNCTYKYSQTMNINFPKLITLREDGKQSRAKDYITEQLKCLWNTLDKIENGNVSLSGIFFPIDEKRDPVLCEIVLKQNIRLPYTLQKRFDTSHR